MMLLKRPSCESRSDTARLSMLWAARWFLYVFSFFMETALARLADTNSIRKSFNFLEIKKNIDAIGWRNYAKEYTLIIVTIVFLSYLSAFSLPFSFLDSLVDMFLSFLIFATQYLGIGAVYSKIKDIENRVVIPVDEMQE